MVAVVPTVKVVAAAVSLAVGKVQRQSIMADLVSVLMAIRPIQLAETLAWVARSMVPAAMVEMLQK
jgi:hypothetical protein